MWNGVLSANDIQRLDYLEIINSRDYSQQMGNMWDYSRQFFLFFIFFMSPTFPLSNLLFNKIIYL